MGVSLPGSAEVGIVVIGRNEGERLRAALQSLPEGVPVVYVDSGSSDGSSALARGQGATVIELSEPPGFTAARSRNAGFRALLEAAPDLRYVQMLDGDCQLDPDWLERGLSAIQADPALAAVFGRVRERFPDASLYNALCDEEWDVPVGEARACGGIALFRAAALAEAGGYTEGLIAGEEPELCLRLRNRRWRIRRIDAEMTRHDADMHRFGQWWRRMRRGGHAYAELAWRHGRGADSDWTRSVASILVWALLLPACAAIMTGVALATGSAWAAVLVILLLALYPIQILRIARRKAKAGANPRFARASAAMLVLGKFAQLGGVLRFSVARLSGARPRLIEHKQVG